MAMTYYGKFRVAGTSTPQLAQAQANSQSEAKRIFEAQFGKISGVQIMGRGRGQPPPSWWR